MTDIRPGYLLTRRATFVAIVGVLLGMFLSVLNQTIVATALPTIVDDLGGLSHYSWVFTIYMLAVVVTVPLYGRLSDIHGRRPFLLAGLVFFMSGSMIGGLANSMTQLVIARGIQGVGAGALMPLAMAVIGDLVPPSDRGRWQGMTGAVFGIASILGPASGGWIADNANWRWVFFVSLPVGLVAFAVVATTLKIPPHPDRARRIDYIGAALLAAGLSAGLLAVVQGGQSSPWASAHILGLFGIAAAVLAVFVWHERRADDPIVPIELFRLRIFTLANLAGFSVGMGLFGAIMFVPLFVQTVLGRSATSAGLVLMPLMLALIVTSIGSGQVITRTGRYKWALVTGPFVMLAGFGLLLNLSVNSSSSDVTVAVVVLGLGLGLLLQNLILVLQNSVPSKDMGVATSASQFFRTTGGMIGVSVMGSILASGLPADARSSFGSGSKAVGAIDEATKLQLANGIHDAFWIGVPVTVVALILITQIAEIPLRRTVREHASEPPASDGLGTYSPSSVTPDSPQPR